MHTRTVRPEPADGPVVTDDPFADLLETPGTEDAHPTDGDVQTLDALFADAPRRGPPPTQAPPGSHWPQHNYGAAYQTLRRAPGTRRPNVLSESDLWDVDQLTHEPRPEPEPPEPRHAPWRTPTPAADPLGWLDTLDPSRADARTTEARLVDLAWGRPLHPTLFEATDILHARPRSTRVHVAAPVPKERLVHPAVKIATLSFLTLFALAVLQLLLS